MLSIDQLVAVLWRRRITFLVTFLLVLGAAALTTFLMPKVYTTGAYLYVTTAGQAGNDFEQVQINQVISKTFAELLQTRNVADEVEAALPFDVPAEQLQRTVEITPIQSSQLITITASSSTAERAQTIANTYAETFVQNADRIAGSSDNTEVRIAERAPLIPNQSRPRPKLYMLIGAILAALTAAGAALLRQRTDQRLELDSSVTEVSGLPLIGRVSGGAEPDLAQLLEGAELELSHRRAEEEYRLLFANMGFANQGRRPGTVAIVSASQGEGKSTTAVSLARAAAELGVRTLIVDADLRRPRVSSAVAHGLAPSGLSSFLVSLEAVAISDIAIELVPNLSLIPAGPVPVNPAALLGSDEFRHFVSRTAKVYDLVIFDTPPLAVGADASLVCSQVEGVVLVIDARSTRRTPLLRAIDQLQRAKANVLGLVVNRAETEDTGSYYYFDHDGDGTSEKPSRRRSKAAAGAPEG